MVGACKKKEIYPVIPAIEWNSKYYRLEKDIFGINDTLLGIVVTYKDGDGDIGLNEGDTFPPFDRQADSLGIIHNLYYYNYIVEYQEIINGEKKPYIIPNTPDTLKLLTRISSLTPDGVHKAIRGDIQYEFPIPKTSERNSDSIVLKITLYDRELHPSNVVESPVILLP